MILDTVDKGSQIPLSSSNLTLRFSKHWLSLYCTSGITVLGIICSVAKLCPTLCDPSDCSPSGSSVHGISKARKLEWVATSFSRGFSRPWNWTHISSIGRQILYHWATREAHRYYLLYIFITWNVPQRMQWWKRLGPWLWEASRYEDRSLKIWWVERLCYRCTVGRPGSQGELPGRGEWWRWIPALA